MRNCRCVLADSIASSLLDGANTALCFLFLMAAPPARGAPAPPSVFVHLKCGHVLGYTHLFFHPHDLYAEPEPGAVPTLHKLIDQAGTAIQIGCLESNSFTEQATELKRGDGYADMWQEGFRGYDSRSIQCVSCHGDVGWKFRRKQTANPLPLKADFLALDSDSWGYAPRQRRGVSLLWLAAILPIMASLLIYLGSPALLPLEASHKHVSEFTATSPAVPLPTPVSETPFASPVPLHLVHECGAAVGSSDLIFHRDELYGSQPAASVEFPQHSVTNYAGQHFHITCLVDNDETSLAVDFELGYSYDDRKPWFPGFEWRNMYCIECEEHVGWRYRRTPNAPKSAPEHFYAVDRDRVHIQATPLKAKAAAATLSVKPTSPAPQRQESSADAVHP